MRCTKCGTESTTSRKFCAACGSPLSRGCPKCGAENAPSSAFCEDCGTALAGQAAPAAASSSPAASIAPNIRVTPEGPSASMVLEGERKTITALFADLKGSTELMEALDPEEARAIVDPALRIMVDAVRRYEGYVVQSTGDGIFALFGAPAAYEDHPQRALYAALQMQQGLREYGQRRTAQGQAVLEARIGVNTGEVVVRSVETGGKVEYTRKLVEGYFELRALGPMPVKGISEPINVYEVVGIGALRGHFDVAARRGLTKFVGRERELEQLRRALEQAIDGRGQIVGVMADAGTGKSRLFHEFKATIPAECKVLEAYSVSHGKASAWLPVLELLRDYFGIKDVDDAAARREKVGVALAALDPSLNDARPYLFGLLGVVEGPDPLAQMDPQIKRQRTLDAIKRILLRECLNQPLVVIFEDLHWIDEQTQALLDLLTDSIANASVLLLVNYRPEYSHQWSGKSYYSQIRLDPLGGANGAAMLAALLGEGVELNPLKRLVIERTGGNPFFIEEIVQALFDEGALVRNGVVKITRSLSQLRLPPTVQGILASRIDRQPSEHKQLLQTLAVIGRESPLGVIRRMTSTSRAQLEPTLAELRAGEFIYEQPAAGGLEYVFKHALTQEVAYNSLLIERRKQLHERAGQALEGIFAEQLDDHLTQLAHHYSHSDNVEKAIEYLGRAGQQALQRAAHADAITSLTAAIELLQSFPEGPERFQRELPLQLAIGPAFIALKGWGAPEMERAFARARELCRRLGDPPEIFPALVGLCSTHLVRGEMRAAKEMAEQLLQLAEKTGDPHLLLWAHSHIANTSFHRGDLLTAREHEEAAIALYDSERDATRRYVGIDIGVAELSYGCWILWHLGYADQALKMSHEACELAVAASHPDSIAFAFGYQCSLRWLRAETGAVRELAERQIVLCTEYGLATFLAAANFYLGWVMAIQGRGTEGIDQIQKSIAAQRATGFGMLRPSNLAMLAEACLVANRFDDGLTAVREALTTAQDREEYCHVPELHRLRGELMLKQGKPDVAEAQSCFERAIEISRKRSAKSGVAGDEESCAVAPRYRPLRRSPRDARQHLQLVHRRLRHRRSKGR
jgi:predicted ATPase/class 3 adenylate cyclase